jgi:hypothetical protein
VKILKHRATPNNPRSPRRYQRDEPRIWFAAIPVSASDLSATVPTFKGQITTDTGFASSVGLWDLKFGNGVPGNSNTLDSLGTRTAFSDTDQ